MKPVVIRAPFHLGLRPRPDGTEPGAWGAPAALSAAGLLEKVAATEVIDLARPDYETDASIPFALNGLAIRRFNLQLAQSVAETVERGAWPLVIGGDCSILLGALAGCRRKGPLSLVHVDGHSDFRHPGNTDVESSPFTVAGMDLALATGRGDPLLTLWPGIAEYLVPDEQTVQLGERNSRLENFPWRDIAETSITSIDIFEANELSAQQLLDRIHQVLQRQPDWPFWLHLDVDVFDQDVLPAVDSPGSPGLAPEKLEILLQALLHDNPCAGMTVTVFDPSLDATGSQARFLAGFLGNVFTASS
jgi:arginase